MLADGSFVSIGAGAESFGAGANEAIRTVPVIVSAATSIASTALPAYMNRRKRCAESTAVI
jgi:hypothetical protein